MARIEKVISVTEFEQGSIYNSGEFFDSTTRIRSIDIVDITGFTKVSVKAYDTSGNPLMTTFMGYNSAKEPDSSAESILGAWYNNGDTIDLSGTSIKGLRIIHKTPDTTDIIPADLGSCEITLILETAWLIQDSYPYVEDLNEPIEVLSEPIPYIAMTLAENEYPKYSFLEPLEIPENPTPYSLMVQKKNEYPKYNYLNTIDAGAFANATNLRYIRIPESVKKIGKTAFRNTALTSVTIARDCEYYPKSFPDGCVINFY